MAGKEVRKDGKVKFANKQKRIFEMCLGDVFGNSVELGLGIFEGCSKEAFVN